MKKLYFIKLLFLLTIFNVHAAFVAIVKRTLRTSTQVLACGRCNQVIHDCNRAINNLAKQAAAILTAQDKTIGQQAQTLTICQLKIETLERKLQQILQKNKKSNK